MNEDTAPGGLDAPHRRRVRWDPTINLGHILTFFGFVATGAVAYSDLKQAHAVHETRINAIEQGALSEKVRLQQELREMRADIKDDIKDLRRAVDDANRRHQGVRP